MPCSSNPEVVPADLLWYTAAAALGVGVVPIR
jgi:hypothetical protein